MNGLLAEYLAELSGPTPVGVIVRFFCFLNTAVNAVVTNRKLRSQLLDENTVKLWGANVLIDHDPNFSWGIEMGYEDVLHSLTAFASHPLGCTDFHSVNCFSSIKKQISSKLSRLQEFWFI